MRLGRSAVGRAAGARPRARTAAAPAARRDPGPRTGRSARRRRAADSASLGRATSTRSPRSAREGDPRLPERRLADPRLAARAPAPSARTAARERIGPPNALASRPIIATLSQTVIGQSPRRPAPPRPQALLAGPGDAFEVKVDGYVIDLVRADGELVEIQTGSFSPLRAKLDALLDRHRMRIVHPIPAQRRILRVDERRRGALHPAFTEEARGDHDLRRASSPSRRCSTPPEPDGRGPALPRGPRARARARPRPPLPARPGRAAPARGARADRADAARPTPLHCCPRSSPRSPRASSPRR